MMEMNYKLIYKVRKGQFKTDSASNLRVQYENKARAEAEKEHKKYLDFIEKELGNTEFEVTNISCMADGVIGHVYAGSTQKGHGKRNCIYCGCDDFDGY